MSLKPLAALALGAVLAAALPAAAQRSGKEADLGKKEDAGGPSKDLAGDVTRPKKDAKKGEGPRPTLEYDKFRFSVELQLKEKRRDLINTLQQMSQLNNDPKEKPDLLFRLGELYWEESRYWFFEANRLDDKAIRCKADGDKACAEAALAEKKSYLRKQEQFQAEAIGRYKDIFKQFPQYPRLDEVLFFLAQNLYEKGEVKDALKAYEQLIRRFPKSRYIPDSYLAFGEFYFNNSGGKRDRIAKALEAYTRAASFTESKVYGFAIYKQGWCHYNLGDFQQAADKFKATVFYGDLATNVGNDNKTALVREARKDFVLAYSHFGNPTTAKDEFKKVGGEENWWGMLNGLAGLYYDDGKDKEAVLVYRQLIKERPLSPQAPFYQGRIVDAVMRVGKKQITVDQARLLVKIFQDVEKSGNVKTEQDKQAIKEAKELAERTLSNLAVSWHNEGKKTRDEETFTYANEAYNDYLTIFPDSPKSYDLRFFHAELLFENLQRYELAAEEYSKVVAMDVDKIEKQKQKPGKWLVKSAEGALFSYDEVAKKFEDKDTGAKDPKKQYPIPAPKQALLTASENYLKYVPGGDKRVEIGYKAAQIYYRYNYFDEAVKRFADISLNHPEHELAVYSANLILDVYNILEDYEKIDEWARKFYAEPKLAKGEFKGDLEKILEKNTFKLAEGIGQKGRHGEAAEKYVAFVKEWPKSELADEALFNASVEYFKARKIESAIALRDRIVREYRDSNLAPQALYLNAAQYEEIGEFGKAADYYELYVARWEDQRGGGKAKGKGKKAPPKKAAPKKKQDAKAGKAADRGSGEYEEAKAKTALFNAGTFREGLRSYKKALKNRERYLELWPNDADAEAIFLSIAELHEKNKKWNDALRQLEAYGRKYTRDANKVLANEYRMVRIYERTRNKGAIKKSYERIWDYYRKLPGRTKEKLTADPGGGREAVAHAHLYLSEALWDDDAPNRHRLPEQEMAQTLNHKAAKLGEVQKRYTETVGFKVAGPAICGLQKIGMAYRNFAQTLYDAPVPKGLNEEGIDNYKAVLAEQAQPVEQKAVEALGTAVEKARELDVYNECSAEALAILEEKASDKYPQVVETTLAPKPQPAPKLGAGLVGEIFAIPPPPESGQGAKVADVKIPKETPVDPEPSRAEKRELGIGRGGSPTAPVDEPPLPKKKGDEPDDEDLL